MKLKVEWCQSLKYSWRIHFKMAYNWECFLFYGLNNQDEKNQLRLLIKGYFWHEKLKCIYSDILFGIFVGTWKATKFYEPCADPWFYIWYFIILLWFFLILIWTFERALVWQFFFPHFSQLSSGSHELDGTVLVDYSSEP